MITQENEIEIDTKKYIPYLEIKKYYSQRQKISVSMVIDFEKEIIEIQRRKKDGFNHSLYDISADMITDGINLFSRNLIEKYIRTETLPIEGYEIWYIAKYYDLNGRKHEILFLTEDMSNPIYSILHWIKHYYNLFEDIREF